MLFSPSLTLAPCSLLFPTRSLQNREPGDRQPNITQTVAEKNPRKQKYPNLVGKNHAPNPLKSNKNTRQTESWRNYGVDTFEKRRRHPGCSCRRICFCGFGRLPWLRNTIYSNRVRKCCCSWISPSLVVVKEGMAFLLINLLEIKTKVDSGKGATYYYYYYYYYPENPIQGLQGSITIQANIAVFFQYALYFKMCTLYYHICPVCPVCPVYPIWKYRVFSMTCVKIQGRHEDMYFMF